MNLKDPNVQKILLGVILVVIVTYVYFGTTLLPFCYQVRRTHIQELETEYAKLSADLEKARKTVGRLAQLEAEYERLHDQWLSAQELLPEEQEMPDLLRKVTSAGNKAGIEFLLFQPGSPVVREVYKEHPVKVRVKGGYHQLGIFLSRLANMARIVNVTGMQVNAGAQAKKGQKDSDERNTIVADFTLTAYTLTEAVVENGGESIGQNTQTSQNTN